MLYILQTNLNEIVDSFDVVNLKEELLRGIYGYGFEKPTTIQQRTIIHCVQGFCSCIAFLFLHVNIIARAYVLLMSFNFQNTILSLKRSQVLVKLPHSVSQFCRRSTLTTGNVKH